MAAGGSASDRKMEQDAQRLFGAVLYGSIQLIAPVRQDLDISVGFKRAGTGADGMHRCPDEGSGGRMKKEEVAVFITKRANVACT